MDDGSHMTEFILTKIAEGDYTIKFACSHNLEEAMSDILADIFTLDELSTSARSTEGGMITWRLAVEHDLRDKIYDIIVRHVYGDVRFRTRSDN